MVMLDILLDHKWLLDSVKQTTLLRCNLTVLYLQSGALCPRASMALEWGPHAGCPSARRSSLSWKHRTFINPCDSPGPKRGIASIYHGSNFEAHDIPSHCSSKGSKWMRSPVGNSIQQLPHAPLPWPQTYKSLPTLLPWQSFPKSTVFMQALTQALLCEGLPSPGREGEMLKCSGNKLCPHILFEFYIHDLINSHIMR